MESIKIAVIGVGGRTGTMLAFELGSHANVLGVAREAEMEMIAQKRLYVQKKEQDPQVVECKIVKDSDFEAGLAPDIIFITTKNPVYEVVKHYFGKFKNTKPPVLFLSQNGIDALNDAKRALNDVYGPKAEDVTIIRSVLFNPVDVRKENSDTYIKYSLPIRLALSKTQGTKDTTRILELFKKAGFKVQRFSKGDARNIEFSKLFLNLIGMASASHNLSVKKGFESKEVFRQEVEVLREYARAVKKSNGRFVNFSSYPVKTYSFLISMLPMFILTSLRGLLAWLLSKGREEKPKDLDEIGYYNGAVVRLGKKTNTDTPVNESVLERVT